MAFSGFLQRRVGYHMRLTRNYTTSERYHVIGHEVFSESRGVYALYLHSEYTPMTIWLCLPRRQYQQKQKKKVETANHSFIKAEITNLKVVCLIEVLFSHFLFVDALFLRYFCLCC